MSKTNPNRKYDLEERLIKFAALAGDLISTIRKVRDTRNIIDQLSRASESAALNYGEAQVAESRADFNHKLSVVLKELKESRVAIKIIKIKKFSSDPMTLEKCDKECSELVAIFVSSIKTSRGNGK
jgi:four helix bundle protein